MAGARSRVGQEGAEASRDAKDAATYGAATRSSAGGPFARARYRARVGRLDVDKGPVRAGLLFGVPNDLLGGGTSPPPWKPNRSGLWPTGSMSLGIVHTSPRRNTCNKPISTT